MIVKQSNKPRNIVTNAPELNMHTFSNVTILFGILGMLSGGFYTSKTLDILPKMPLIFAAV